MLRSSNLKLLTAGLKCLLHKLQAQYKDFQVELGVSSIPQVHSSLSLSLSALFVTHYEMILSIFAASLLLVPTANAFWRLPCAMPVLDARVDPIVSPGGPSSHVHTIMGSNGT